MRNRFSIFSACVLLLIVALMPTVARAETGEVTVTYRFTQNQLTAVNDLHIKIKIKEHSEIVYVNYVRVDPEATTVEVV
ncbi:MAG: hypothetical protein KOO63_10460, partial [Bacteroidales bacterium]|nr:hypothetical protein [Candidatus Latescibacterota bacterium]